METNKQWPKSKHASGAWIKCAYLLHKYNRGEDISLEMEARSIVDSYYGTVYGTAIHPKPWSYDETKDVVLNMEDLIDFLKEEQKDWKKEEDQS